MSVYLLITTERRDVGGDSDIEVNKVVKVSNDRGEIEKAVMTILGSAVHSLPNDLWLEEYDTDTGTRINVWWRWPGKYDKGWEATTLSPWEE